MLGSLETCQHCGGVLGRHAPGRHCARCLLKAGLDGGSRGELNSWAEAGFLGAADSEPALGRCGDYELIEEIARGGMGVVYRARQAGSGRIVALKMILSGPFARQSELRRFNKEVEAAARLDHPNIVPIYEAGDHDGRPYFSMRFLEGGTLATRLASGEPPLSAGEAAGIASKVARAVHYAHQCGVIHRDIKPGNVLLDSGGEPYVSDFGLVKRVEGDSRATVSGAVLGSPSYMSPEQAAGKPRKLTAAADVYGVGAILYELIAHRPPFRANTPLATLKQVIEDEPIPPAQFNRRIDRDLQTICLKCLEKEPGRRYHSAKDLADDLDRWQRGEPIAARRTTALESVQKWIRRKPALAAATGACLVAAGILIAGWCRSGLGLIEANRRIQAEAAANARQVIELHIRAGERLVGNQDPLRALHYFAEALRLDSADPARAEVHRLRLATTLDQSPQVTALMQHRDGVWAMAFSPDGKRLATASADQTARVWDITGDGRALTPALEHEANVQAIGFSPDGRWTATMGRDGRARLWDGATGEPGSPWLTPAAGDFQPASDRLKPSLRFSPDGRTVLTAHGSRGVRLWDVAGGALLRQFDHPAVVRDAAFCPDGLRVLTGCADGVARLWNMRTGQLEENVLEHGDPVDWVGFTKDGRRFFTVVERRLIQIWDTETRRPVGSSIRPGHVLFDVAFSPDGDRLATGGWHGPVWIWDVASGRPLRAMPHDGGVTRLSWSPNGLRLATACWDGTARTWNADTGQLDGALLPHATPLLQVCFSPDGRLLATGAANGVVQVWNLASVAPARGMAHAVVERGEFSRDGRSIVTVARDPFTPVRVWDTETAGLAASFSTTSKVESATFSPDGSDVVIASGDGTARVWRWTAGSASEATSRRSATTASPTAKGGIPRHESSSAPPRLTLAHPAGVNAAVFSPDGNRIATACQDGVARLWDSGEGRLIATLRHAGPVQRVEFSPDGHRLATGGADRMARVWSGFTGEPVSQPLEHQGDVHRIAFSPDGHQLVTACRAESWPGDGSSYAQVWDIAGSVAIGGRLRHLATVNDVAFSPDGRRVATASSDQTVQVWDAVVGRPLTPSIRQNNEAMQARFSPDGALLATGNNSGEVQIWDAATGRTVSPVMSHGARHDLMVVRFSPDGRRLLVASGDDQAWLHTLDSAAYASNQLTAAVRVLTGHRMDDHGGLVPLQAAENIDAWRQWRRN